jgi:hypothetical protein
MRPSRTSQCLFEHRKEFGLDPAHLLDREGRHDSGQHEEHDTNAQQKKRRLDDPGRAQGPVEDPAGNQAGDLKQEIERL